MDNKGRRGRIWINSAVQSYLMVHGVIFGGMVLLLMILGDYIFFQATVNRLNALGISADQEFVQFLFESHRQKTIFISVAALLILSLGALHMLFVSHRIAGPIYKIRLRLQEFREQKRIDRITLRKGDFFEELAKTMNDFFEENELRPKKSDQSKGSTE